MENKAPDPPREEEATLARPAAAPSPADEDSQATLAPKTPSPDDEDSQATLAGKAPPAAATPAAPKAAPPITPAANLSDDWDAEATAASTPIANALSGSGTASPVPASHPPSHGAHGEGRAVDSASVPVQGDLPGAPLASEQPGRYVIKRIYGKGGQGVVYLALDASIGRDVALKVLTARASGSSGVGMAGVEARFLREARITGQLEHPSIVPVHEVGRRADGSVYYTQKLVRGRTLHEALDECKGLEDRLKLLGHFVDICQAIAYAHGRGVVHRDLKPGNVMVGEFGVTVVLDWGLAKVLGREEVAIPTISGSHPAAEKPADHSAARAEMESDADSASTRDGAILGTPLYMSPEQAAGHLSEIDEKTDIWALGAMLYQLLTGKTPFEGGNSFMVLTRVQKAQFRRVVSLCPEAPPELAAVAERALQKDRADRYQSARELATEVEAFLLGGRVTAYDYSPWELVKKLVAKNPIAAGASMLALVVFVIASLLLLRAHTRTVSLLSETLSLHAAGALAEQRWPQAAAWFAASRVQEERTDARLGEAVAELLAPVPLMRLAPHEPHAQAVLFSGDGTKIVSTASDGALRIWDAKTGALLTKTQAHRGLVPTVAIASNGTIATGGGDGLVKLFSPEGNVLGELRPSSIQTAEPAEGSPEAGEGNEGTPSTGIASLDFSPDGKLLAVASLEAGAELWDVQSRARVATIQESADKVLAIAFSPDGAQLALGFFDGTLRIIEANPGADGLRRELFRKAVHTGRLRVLAWSADGKRLATGGQDGLVQIFQIGNTGAPATAPEIVEAPLRLELHQRAVDGVRFTPDGGQLASSSRDGLVVLWDANTGRVLARLDADERAANFVTFSPDGKLLAAAYQDESVRVWSMPEERGIVGLVGHTDALRAIAFSPSAAQLASVAQDGALRLWDVRSARSTQILDVGTTKPRAVLYSPDGTMLVTGGDGDSLRLWDPARGVFLRRLVAPGIDNSEGVGGLAFAPRSHLLFTGGRHGTLRLWDLDTKQIRWQIPTNHPAIESVAVSPDGRRIASAGNDGFVRIWEAATGKAITEIHAHGEACRGVSFSPDGTLLASAGSDRRLTLFETRRWTPVRELAGHRGRVFTAAFSPGGRWLASSSTDRGLRIYEVASGEQIFSSTRNDGPLVDVAWSSDDRLLATASADKTIELLRIDDGRDLPSPAESLGRVLRTQWLRLIGLRVEAIPEEKRPRSPSH